MEEHRTLIRTRPQVVFATPGRLNDHLGKGNISTDAIRLLIIDEFDKCLDMGFENEMYSILNKLPYIRRRILLSATDSPRISRFIDIRSGLRIDFLSETEVRSSRITVYEVRSPEKDKLPAFSKNNSTISKAIREKKKTFYRVLSNDKNKLEIDTLSSLTIYDGLVIDKLSMDWYIINTECEV